MEILCAGDEDHHHLLWLYSAVLLCSGHASLARKSGSTIRPRDAQERQEIIVRSSLVNVAVMTSMVASDWKKINQPSLSRDLNGSVVWGYQRRRPDPLRLRRGWLFRFYGRPILQIVDRIIVALSLKRLPFLCSKKICHAYIYNMFHTHKKDNCEKHSLFNLI